jgi:UDP-N-acetyl-D-glucosamine dehydrogenase
MGRICVHKLFFVDSAFSEQAKQITAAFPDRRRRAFITGITGQDGSYLAELLIAQGYEVHGIKRRSSSFHTEGVDHLISDWREHETRFFLHRADLLDATSLKLLYRIAPDEIYHLGAQSHVPVSFDIPEHTGDTTALGTTRHVRKLKPPPSGALALSQHFPQEIQRRPPREGFVAPAASHVFRDAAGRFHLASNCYATHAGFVQIRILAIVVFRLETHRLAGCGRGRSIINPNERNQVAVERKPEFFASKDIKIGIIGCGYVGLPLALRFADVGQRVTGFDLDQEKVKKLNAGQSYIQHIPAEKIQHHVQAKRFDATADFARLREMDAVLICVPTPLDERREPDLSYVENTAKAIAPNLQRNQLIVLESTTYPGTTEELVLPILEKSGLRCPLVKGSAAENTPTDFYLAFSPEREDPGNKQYGLAQIPKVVGGINPHSGRAAAALYTQIVSKVVPVSSTRAAEMVKLLENIFRCVNIALVNELKQLSLRMDLDIWEVIDSAATKPFGFMPFYPGPGLGGHCIPVDPYYLSWKAREYDFATRFIELAGEINTAMPYNVVEALVTALNDHQKSVKGSKILLLGVAYKKDVDDLRESPSLKLLELLTARGANLDYNDPYFPCLHKMRHYDFSHMKSVDLTPQRLASYDCVLIATDHTSYDYAAIVRDAKLVVDTRNATRNVPQHEGKVVHC